MQVLESAQGSVWRPLRSSTAGSERKWSPAAGLNTTTGPTVTASPTSTTKYTVIGSDDQNCFKDTTHFNIKVFPIPKVSAGNDTTINVGQNVTLTPALSSDVTNVVWSPLTGIVSSNLPSVTVHPTMDMQYTVKATNPGGCFASDFLTFSHFLTAKRSLVGCAPSKAD